MDYEGLSDFEVNKLVAGKLGMADIRQLKNVTNSIHCEINGVRGFKDFCNNAADAWPIIVDNNISVIKFSDDCDGEWIVGHDVYDQSHHEGAAP